MEESAPFRILLDPLIIPILSRVTYSESLIRSRVGVGVVRSARAVLAPVNANGNPERYRHRMPILSAF